MPLPSSIVEMMSSTVGGVRKAKQGGYFYLIKGKKLPWLSMAKNQSMAYKKHKAAMKAIKGGASEGNFKASDPVLQGPVLFKNNRIVLVLGPESAIKNGDAVSGWLTRAGGALAAEDSKELKVIGAVLKKAACVGHEEASAMDTVDTEEEADYSEDGVDPFDEADVEDGERIAGTVQEQFAALTSNQLGLRVTAVESQLLGTARLVYEAATGILEAALGDEWEKASLSDFREKAPSSTGANAWIHEQLGDLEMDCAIAYNMVVDLNPDDVEGLAGFLADIEATVNSINEHRNAILQALPKCQICFDKIGLDQSKIHPHVGKDSCALNFHAVCFDELSLVHQVMYIMIQPAGKGHKAKCSVCKDEVDATIYAPIIGDKARRIQAIADADPTVDETGKYTGPLPMGAFPCPVCGHGYGWGGGCDVITCPTCGDFNIITFKQIGDITKGARHSSDFRQNLRDVREALKEKKFAKFLEKLQRNYQVRKALYLDTKIPQLEQAANDKDADRVHEICGPMCPTAVIDACHIRIRDHYLKKAGSKCYLTTACTQARGLPDDCAELETLRAFRDGYLAAQPGGPALIERYYETAPRIVDDIQACADADARLEAIYQVVRGCVDDINASRPHAALSAYAAMVEGLTAAHLS